MATIVTRETGATAVNRTLTNAELDNNFINLNADVASRILSSEKAAANGVATLDATGKVPSTQLPSYVDDVLEAANLAAFPATGETGKIYVALDTNKAYRWSGSTYIYITSGAVDSVAGRTGAVVLTKSDVGLGSVDNTADSAKAVLSATKWATARTFSITGDLTGSASVDGSANISFTGTLANTGVGAGSYGSATAIPVITVDAKGRVTGLSTTAVSIPSGSISVTGGDLTMSGTTGTAITNATLVNTGVTAGTYNTVTVDAKGRVTSGSNASYLTTSGKAADSELLDGQDSTGFLRYLSTGAEASIDSYVDNGFRAVSYTGHSKHMLSWNAGGSTGTVQQEFHYNTPANGWRIRNKTDNTSWSTWGYVVMASTNQGLISGTIYHSGNPPPYPAEADTLATVTARGATTSTATTFTGTLYSRKSQTDGTYTTAALWTESYDNTTTGIAFHISGVVGKFLEMRTNGTLYWNSDIILHTGNYTSYAIAKNGSSWTPHPSTNRSADWNTFYTDYGYIQFGPANSSWAHIYSDKSFYFNQGIWINNNRVLDAGNYTSYFPSWSTGVNANHLVQRDGNGYIYANHINFNTSETENPSINSFFVSNGDGWSRKASKSHVISQLGLDGRYVQRIDGDSGSFDLNVSGQHAWVRFSTGAWTNNPYAGNYSHVLSFNAASDNRTAQIYIGDVQGAMYVRRSQGGAGTWHPWEKVLTSYNWGDYAAAVSHSHSYLPLSGGLMTGDIRFSGNARVGVEDGGIDCYLEITDQNPTYDGYSYGAEFFMYGDKSISSSLLEAGGIKSNTQIWVSGNRVLHAGNYTNYTLPIGGGWYGSGLPGSRWGGYSVNGGEISFGRDLPNNGQMGILVDGCYVAGENNGFWSLASDNTWGSRRGMYWDGSYLNFTTNTPSARFQGILTDGRANLFDTVVKQYLYVRHIEGKNWDTFDASASGLYLQYASNGNVYIGSGANIALHAGNYTNYISYGYSGWPGYPGTDANTFHSGSWLRSSFTYSNNAPYTGTIVHFPSSGYDLQFNGTYSSTGLAFRNRNGDSGTWNAWSTVLHSNNYTSYSPSLTGSGASGTWGISITGSAGSAGTAGNATTADKVNSVGGYPHPGTGMYPFYNWGGSNGGASAPSSGSYTIGISVGSHPGDQAYGFQIARNMWNTGLWTRGYDSGYGSWVRLLDSSNYTDYCATSGHNHTYNVNNEWLRENGDDAQFKMYGNTRTMIYRTDGNTNDHGGGAYAHIFYYGGSADGNRKLIIGTDGNFWNSYYGVWHTDWFNQNVRTDAGPSFGNVYTSGWFRNYGSQGIYNQDYGNHFYADGAYWNVGYAGTTGIRLRNGHAGTVLGYFYAETSQNCGILNSSGNWAVQVYPGSTGGGNLAGTWTGGNLKANRANGNLYIDDNYGNTVVGVYSSYRYQGVYAMGDSYKLPADGTTTGSLYGLAWSHPNTGGAAGNLTNHGLLVLINGSFGSAISDSIVTSGAVTAYSDERLKANWKDLPKDYVARLAKVKVGTYDRTDKDNIRQVGVGAQSFRELLPEAILVANDDMKTLSVSYGNAALASAVELAKEVVDLRAQVERLERLIQKLIEE